MLPSGLGPTEVKHVMKALKQGKHSSTSRIDRGNRIDVSLKRCTYSQIQ